MSSITIPPLSRFLVPVDGSEPSKRAVYFAGCLTVFLENKVEGLTLLHVLAGRYLSQHMANIDVRTERIVESTMFQALKEQYIEKEIMPFLDDAVKTLTELGVKVPVDKEVLDGRPADKILETAQTGGYSTIIIGRRGLSPVREFLLGSVTTSILHRPHHPSVYVVGQRVLEDHNCPVPSILIPVDGSACSMAAVEEASIFGKCMSHCLEKIVLLKVIDIASYQERRGSGESPEADAMAILDRAHKMLVDAGIPESKIEDMAVYGRPARNILEIADKEDINLIIMGRKGRSALKDLVLGGVSSQVLHKAERPTVAIVCRS